MENGNPNRCSCEAISCRACAEDEVRPGECPNDAEFLVVHFGIQTRLCNSCLSERKRLTKEDEHLSWTPIERIVPPPKPSGATKFVRFMKGEGGGISPKQLDLNPKQGVHIEISADGSVLWVNVDGICRLRASNSPRIDVIAPDLRELGAQRKVYHRVSMRRRKENPHDDTSVEL